MAGANDHSKRRFLIVEDESFMAGLIERALRQLKPAEVYRAPNGEAALAFFKDNKLQIDCILSDYNMKPVNGLQLLQAIRSGGHPHIPREQTFVMLTGHGEMDVVKTAIALDVNGYLVKPVSPQKMTQTLDQVFAKSIALKDEAHYRGIELVLPAEPFDEAGRSPVWVILDREDLARGHSPLKEKVERLRGEHAPRPGSGEIRFKNRQQCDLAQLREGMLLAEDIEGEIGVILVRRGTRLTARMIDRLRDIATESKARSFVWVGEIE